MFLPNNITKKKQNDFYCVIPYIVISELRNSIGGNMLKFIYYIFTLFFVIFTLNQNLSAQKEFDNWYFGNKLGITFNTPNREPIELTDGANQAFEGNFTQSDAKGNLLFYIDGNFVFNKNHQKMPQNFINASGESSTQGVIAIKKQDNDSIYYLITVGTESSDKKMRLHILDLRLDNGLGGLLNENQVLIDKPSEKLAAINHYNGKDTWIITAERLRFDTVQYVSFLLTNDGIDINSKVISQKFCKFDDGTCQLKISPNGKYIAAASKRSISEVAEFDNLTGKITNNIILDFDKNIFLRKWRSYSLEFSPDSKKLYVADYDTLRLNCFSLENFEESSILSSHYVLNMKNYFNVKYVNGKTWGMQLAPNGKIYYIATDGDISLYSIDNPNEDFSNLKMSEFIIKNKNKEILYLGLPNIPANFLESQSVDSVNVCDYSCNINLGDTMVYTGDYACVDLEVKLKCNEFIDTFEETDIILKLKYNPFIFQIDKSKYNILAENIMSQNLIEVEILLRNVQFSNDPSQYFQICGNTFLSEFISTNIEIDSIYFEREKFNNKILTIKNGSVKLSHCLGTLRLITFKSLLDLSLFFDQNEKKMNFNITNKNENCNMDYKIIDLIGNCVNIGNINIQSFSTNTYSLDLEQLSPGLYFILINSGLLNKTEKLLINY